MSRLIDADALSHKFFEIGCHITKIHPMDVMNIISEQPTAYDVEKVVAELEKESQYCVPLGGKSFTGIKLDKAIDIVKRGGVK